jgi:ABC-2 type transport system ATP-binding protein
MNAGKIVAQGSPAELKAGIGADVITIRFDDTANAVQQALTAVRRFEGIADVREVDETLVVYVSDGAAALPRIIVMLNDAGLEAKEVTLAQPSLDDVFLRATGRHMTSEDAPPPGVRR